MEKRKVICRRCNQKRDWEITFLTGEKINERYAMREECIKYGLKYAVECGCDLYIYVSNHNNIDME